MATASRPKSVNAVPTTFGNFDNDVIVWEDLFGALLLIRPKEFARGINTEHGTKDAIYADVLVIDGEHAGTEYRDTLVFPATLVGQLRRKALNASHLGRLGKGKAKINEETGEEQNAPWKMLAHTPEDVQIAIELMESRKSSKTA